MAYFLIIFLIVVLSLSLITTVIGEIAFKGVKVSIYTEFYDRKDDPIYYDWNLIEKKLFRQKFTHINDLRTIKSLVRGIGIG